MKKHVLDWVAFTLENKIDILLAALRRRSLFFFLSKPEVHDGCDEYPGFTGEKKSKEKQAIISYGEEKKIGRKKRITVQILIKISSTQP